jgi:antitoxin component of MazEF toxin-antitoxin module
MTKLMRWGNGRGVLIPRYCSLALGIKAGDAVVVSLDTTSRQIVIAPQDTSSIQEQYFVKAAIVAKPKPQDAW